MNITTKVQNFSFKIADDKGLLLEKEEQVIRPIRSKGVGVYFVSQIPEDIPVSIVGLLSNRILHALRAITPKTEEWLVRRRKC